MPSLRHLKETISEKMRLEAPELFAELRAKGTLDQLIEEMVEDLSAVVVDASLQAGRAPALQSAQMHLQRVQAMEEAARRTLETLLSELEFPGNEPTSVD